ncbi:MAG: 50S ribosomal protein L11 methyltransferase [Ferruginibacter sp.]|nr:50S ribosomal protein L11 methyltransferase [Ferruginibacter sp.]
MDHYQFIFNSINKESKEQLIALLDNIGFEGFEEGEEMLTAFVAIDKFDEIEFGNIIATNSVSYSKSIIKETNWNKEWEAGFEPVTIYHPVSGIPFVAVRANFHLAVPGVLHDLVITPKMSFGTGHHATTYLMIREMSLLDCKNKTVIDFGTGTGVLAILAEKLGASKVIGIDIDDWSIDNAKENTAANGCVKIDILKGETITAGINGDLILANINLNIIIGSLEVIRNACNIDAVILFSGIMLQDRDHILSVLAENQFHINKVVTKDNWLAISTNL